LALYKIRQDYANYDCQNNWQLRSIPPLSRRADEMKVGLTYKG